MKTKIFTFAVVLSFCFTLLTLNSYSQPPVTAADFSYQDINGITHHLYDYLDSGKTVIIDFSTTWCTPCWQFHNTHLLKEVYNDFGPDGTDEIMALFIEVDASTTLDNLNGLGSATHGNWVTGTPYPIINLPTATDVDFFNTNYNISSVPTIYVICPDRSVSEISNDTISYYSLIHETVKCTPPTGGTDARLLMYSGDESTCGDIDVRIVIYNNGTDTLTNLSVNAYNEDSLFADVDWSGNIPPGDTAGVYIETIAIDQDSADFRFEITTPDDNMDNNIFSKNVRFAPSVSSQIRVNIYTGQMLVPMDVRWRIEDDNANIIVQSGYLEVYTSYDSVYVIPQGCYHFIITSVMGSGFDGSVCVSDTVTQKIIYNNPAFESVGTSSFEVNTNAAVENTSHTILADFFPNPVSDKLTLSFSGTVPENISVRLADILGQAVSCPVQCELSGNTSAMVIDMSALKKGIYILYILTVHETVSEKIIKR